MSNNDEISTNAGKVITYSIDPRTGIFSQVRLGNGERILISIAQSGLLITKLFSGVIPIKTIFKISLGRMALLVGKNSTPPYHEPVKLQLDFFKNICLQSHNSKDLSDKLNTLSSIVSTKS